jgi:hypothetical protein
MTSKIEGDRCQCGHLRDVHEKKSNSINFTNGRCMYKDCDCQHFQMPSPDQSQRKITIQLGKLDAKFLFKAIAIATGSREVRLKDVHPRDKEFLLKIADRLWDIYVDAYGYPTEDEIGYKIKKK